jgi:hypothetical protein
MVKRALKVLAEREVSPQTGLLKSTLLQLDSTFSERNYGSSSFLDFTEKLAQAGLVQLKTSGRSVMVELNPDFVESEGAADIVAFPSAADAPADKPAVEPTQSNEEGVAHVGEILRKAANARWPMYIRNVKQIVRAADPQFDERRYGFGGLMDLLRAVQKDGLIRMERDRRGGLRVFPGAGLQRSAASPVLPQPDVAQDEPVIDTTAGDVVQRTPTLVDAGGLDVEAQPVDTTAELLGRAKAKRPRAKGPVPAGGKRKKTAAAKRPSRSRKSAPAVDEDNIGNQ